jgi:hypothetical protein
LSDEKWSFYILYKALYKNYKNIVRVALENAKFNFQGAVRVAYGLGYWNMVDFLLANGQDPFQIKNEVTLYQPIALYKNRYLFITVLHGLNSRFDSKLHDPRVWRIVYKYARYI